MSRFPHLDTRRSGSAAPAIAAHMTDMGISHDASSAREAARKNDGRFGEQEHTEGDVDLGTLHHFIVETADGHEHLVQATDADTAMRQYLADRAHAHEGAAPTRVVQEGDENPGLTLAEDMYGDVWTLEQLENGDAGSTDGLRFFNDPLIEFTDPEERVDLDNVREALTVSPGDGPFNVDAALSLDDDTLVNVDVLVTDSLLWNDSFTEDELNKHNDIVEDVYSEWFNADIDGDDWGGFTVTLRTDIARDHATERLILNRTWDSYAKFRNETDPGTFNSPYVGTEIRKRIDAAEAAEAESDLHMAFERHVAEHGR